MESVSLTRKFCANFGGPQWGNAGELFETSITCSPIKLRERVVRDVGVAR